MAEEQIVRKRGRRIPVIDDLQKLPDGSGRIVTAVYASICSKNTVIRIVFRYRHDKAVDQTALFRIRDLYFDRPGSGIKQIGYDLLIRCITGQYPDFLPFRFCPGNHFMAVQPVGDQISTVADSQTVILPDSRFRKGSQHLAAQLQAGIIRVFKNG